MKRRTFLKLSAGSVLASQLPGCVKTGIRPPNIVLFISDDQGYHDLGCFGNKVIKTPNLDKMASEGMRMTGFYVTCSVCTPSRSGLLTGRYPHRNGLYENIRSNMTDYKHKYKEMEYVFSPEMTQGLDLREITIAQVLKDGGYRTGIFGKWDSGRARRFLPLQRGFDSFYGFANTGVDFWTHERYGMPSMFRGNQRIKDEGYTTDLFKREALKFIEQNKNGPFFLYVPFNAPHGASNLEYRGAQAPDKYVKMYGDLPGTKRQRYMAAVTCMDDAIGGILEKLKQLELEDNTLVLFVSDNGGGDRTPLRGGKGTMYEGGIRVPFIAKWPGHIPRNVVSHEFCSTLDLFPTLVSVSGSKLPRNVIYDGYDITAVLENREKSKRDKMFWELRGKRAARVGHWKWVMETKERYSLPEKNSAELFDLSTDISESNNLAKQEPEKLAEMKNHWETWIREMAASEPRGPYSKAYFDLLGYGDGQYKLTQKNPEKK